ncbi:LysR family transcriptional regulator [Erwinia psidii]|uniref:LysR family transcriptional regulator n=1 Tax=Erwinia psidii TaxID=69224 RepID=A0A3N6TQL3_9GAMM|nr:LysR family transcriptional regulator [Erwinia psidii]MCX8957079.1 LysR family transcriptional regulator [Erwinia psidii]MCX8961731.1 LysR family transcriptional regulator [Erwinia psidii]MCX8965325.1 LysR family transcriptional regulator [Erwinia psidii]RQM37542.1 LysR family transcriptional regulator [Erwinia psidii]
MDLKRMRYFCVIAEQGSISKAARLLNIAPPPLGKRLQELEEEIGSPLFIRTSKKMVLTDTGLFLYRKSSEILSQVNSITRQAIDIASQKKRTICIGVSYLYLRYFNSILLNLYAKNPDWEPDVVVSDSSHLEEMVLKKNVDIAMIQSPREARSFYVHNFEPIKPVAVVSGKLADNFSKQTLSFTDLTGLPLILLQRIGGEGTYEVLLNQLYSEIKKINIIMRVSEPRFVIEMFRTGLAGACIMPESEVGECSLRHYRTFAIEQQVKLFCPAIVTLYSEKDTFLSESQW